MRFMLIRKADEVTEAGILPSGEMLTAMSKYAQEMADAGVLIEGVGLQASSKGARMTRLGGKAIVVDGPFAETKELIGGFFMIRVKSKEEAIAWVTRWPLIDGAAELEIRQVFEEEEVRQTERTPS